MNEPRTRQRRRTDPPVAPPTPQWPSLRQVAAVLGLSTVGTLCTLILAAANWIQLPDTVRGNTRDIAELKQGQVFLVCVARANVRKADPAACDGLDPERRREYAGR
jgi:hypothetical protein